MESYNIINQHAKLRVDSDFLNLIGLIPFNHSKEEPFDKEMKYKNKVDKAVQLSICEFEGLMEVEKEFSLLKILLIFINNLLNIMMNIIELFGS